MFEFLSTASKLQIRQALRKIYDEADDDPPNVNQAWALLKLQLPDAGRRRVREVLKENEFLARRRGPGRKAKRRPSSSAPTPAVPPGI